MTNDYHPQMLSESKAFVEGLRSFVSLSEALQNVLKLNPDDLQAVRDAERSLKMLVIRCQAAYADVLAAQTPEAKETAEALLTKVNTERRQLIIRTEATVQVIAYMVEHNQEVRPEYKRLLSDALALPSVSGGSPISASTSVPTNLTVEVQNGSVNRLHWDAKTGDEILFDIEAAIGDVYAFRGNAATVEAKAYNFRVTTSANEFVHSVKDESGAAVANDVPVHYRVRMIINGLASEWTEPVDVQCQNQKLAGASAKESLIRRYLFDTGEKKTDAVPLEAESAKESPATPPAPAGSFLRRVMGASKREAHS